MDCKFQVGQQVACQFSECWMCGRPTELIKNNVYTIEAMVAFQDVIGLRISGVVACLGQVGLFPHIQFRPIKETNIDVFRKELAPNPREPVKV
jgi:hypothetical protein